MELIPTRGAGDLLFGMTREKVEEALGKPDRIFPDDEHNDIWLYFSHKLRLTFYADEDFRLGYVICSDRNALLFGQPVIGKPLAEVKAMLQPKGIDTWEQEEHDLTVNDFNEKHWVILQSEFGEVVRVELGALINERDEFDWPAK